MSRSAITTSHGKDQQLTWDDIPRSIAFMGTNLARPKSVYTDGTVLLRMKYVKRYGAKLWQRDTLWRPAHEIGLKDLNGTWPTEDQLPLTFQALVGNHEPGEASCGSYVKRPLRSYRHYAAYECAGQRLGYNASILHTIGWLCGPFTMTAQDPATGLGVTILRQGQAKIGLVVPLRDGVIDDAIAVHQLEVAA